MFKPSNEVKTLPYIEQFEEISYENTALCRMNSAVVTDQNNKIRYIGSHSAAPCVLVFFRSTKEPYTSMVLHEAHPLFFRKHCNKVKEYIQSEYTVSLISANHEPFYKCTHMKTILKKDPNCKNISIDVGNGNENAILDVKTGSFINKLPAEILGVCSDALQLIPEKNDSSISIQLDARVEEQLKNYQERLISQKRKYEDRQIQSLTFQSTVFHHPITEVSSIELSDKIMRMGDLDNCFNVLSSGHSYQPTHFNSRLLSTEASQLLSQNQSQQRIAQHNPSIAEILKSLVQLKLGVVTPSSQQRNSDRDSDTEKEKSGEFAAFGQ